MIFSTNVFERILDTHKEKHLNRISKSHNTENPVLHKAACEIQNNKAFRSNAEYLQNLRMENIS